MTLNIADVQAPWISCKGLVGQYNGNLFHTRMTIKVRGDRQEDYDLCMSAFRRSGRYEVMLFESGKTGSHTIRLAKIPHPDLPQDQKERVLTTRIWHKLVKIRPYMFTRRMLRKLATKPVDAILTDSFFRLR